MSDVDPGTGTTGGASPSEPAAEALPPFPWKRMLFALGFAFAAWIVFWFVIVLALLQFVLVLLQSLTGSVSGHPGEELTRFCSRMIHYLGDLLAYVAFVRDERPYPFSPFPDT